MDIVAMDRTCVGDIMSIVEAALPGELLIEDDIAANLFDDHDPTRVVGVRSGAGVAAAVIRRGDERVVCHVQLVAVEPAARRQGIGAALLGDLQRWAFDEHSADVLMAGAGAPFFLWPGVDVHATPALCLFEKLGYATTGAYLDLAYPARFRAPLPDGLDVVRVIEDSDAELAVAFVDEHWPHWVAECRRGIEHGTCHIAVERSSGDVLAFGCHSVNRFEHLGPIGTNPARQRTGVGSALLGVIAADVMAAGLDMVQVSWIGPVRFYAKAAGATTSRAYLKLVLRRPSTPTLSTST